MSRNRPPFVLAFVGDTQGCGTHRIMWPLASLIEQGVADGRVDMSIWPDHVITACSPDVIVWQRQVDDGQIEIMQRWRKLLPNAMFVYELDDYLGEIPKASFHAGFMPPNIAAQVAKAMAVCDRATTTTKPLAEWLMSLVPGMDVRVVPNGLPVKRLREREPRTSGKLRVGFAGGLSHTGDIALIYDAMRDIGEAVDWVFFGFNPENAPCRYEYHDGVPPANYLDKMAQLDFDLMLAPLEDNMFNRCKSNLRLVEAGSVGACVIAQDYTPYHENKPPVFAHAKTPADWTAAIRKFMAAKPTERKRNADALRAWVGRHYVLERLLPLRMDAWLPAGPKWKPTPPLRDRGKLVVASADTDDTRDAHPFLRSAKIVDKGLEAACEQAVSTGADVLWMRPATAISEESITSLCKLLRSDAAISAVVPLASDGPNGFPVADKWTPLSSGITEIVAGIVKENLGNQKLAINAATGPVILLSYPALSMMGFPNVAAYGGNEEQAIMEWCLRSNAREWKQYQLPSAFAASLMQPAQVTQEASSRIQALGLAEKLQAPFEQLNRDQREGIELLMLAKQWGGGRPGVMGFGSDYPAWKALSAARSKYVPQAPDSLLQVRHFGTVTDKQSEWAIWIDENIEIYGDALSRFADVIAENPSAEVIYADHDSKLVDGRLSPELKPEFDLELFLAQDYVTPVCAVRSQNSFVDRFELYDYVLGIGLEQGVKTIKHTSHVLGAQDVSTRPETVAMDVLSRQVIIQDRLQDAVSIAAHKFVLGCLDVMRKWTAEEKPLVSIIVPTLGSGRLLQPCVNTLRQHTLWDNYEIIVVHNGTKFPEAELGDAAKADPRVKVVRWEGQFNWSAINNWAVRFHSKGAYVLTLNDDVCVGRRGWLDSMMGQVAQPDVGVVGARLVHPMGNIQHVGVVCHKGIAGHMHKGLPNGHPGHLGRAFLTHEANAVTGACMLFSRANFDRINGFDETMPRNYNDTDFCMRLRKLGLRNVVEMSAELLHPEGSSRDDVFSPESMRLMRKENKVMTKRYTEPDPYWSPNLGLGMNADGVYIQGMNAELLAWTDALPEPAQERVLVINDKPGMDGIALRLVEQTAIQFSADLSGFTLRMIAPNLQNCAPWDIRNTDRIRASLDMLGVTRVILRSLVGQNGAAAPVEALYGLKALGRAVEVDPVADWMVRPARDDGQSPNVFGHVDVKAWERAYQSLAGIDVLATEAAE